MLPQFVLMTPFVDYDAKKKFNAGQQNKFFHQYDYFPVLAGLAARAGLLLPLLRALDTIIFY